jgi:hypothetical protein
MGRQSKGSSFERWFTSAGFARTALAVLWIGSFCVALSLVAFFYLTNQIEEDNFTLAVTQLNASYSVYVGVVITYALTAGKLGRARSQPRSFIVALVGSLIWNLLILALLTRLLFRLGTIEESVKQITNLSTRLSWLVGPALGFYFGRLATGKPEGTSERHPL